MIFTYYAGIMLDAFLYLLCSQLCQHNWRRPSTSLNIFGRPLTFLSGQIKVCACVCVCAYMCVFASMHVCVRVWLCAGKDKGVCGPRV